MMLTAQTKKATDLMNVLTRQTFIRQKATERKVKWTRHALNELAPEPMSVNDVEIALQQAEVVNDWRTRR
jgi:hypothetical protein